MRVRSEKEKWAQVVLVSAASVLVSLVATHFVSPAGLNWVSVWPATLVPLMIAPFASLWAGNMILALHRSNLRLEHLLLHDSMTGLLNRTAFFDLFEARQQNVGGTVLMLDIDSFKSINDTYGHQVGDSVIRLVTDVMSETARPFGEIARLGGEEFAMFFPNLPVTKGRDVAETIRCAIEKTALDAGPDTISCTISIGVGYRHDNEPIDAALNRADKALYRAKSKGRNRVEVSETQPSEPAS
ncbi:GGDEF domain-containing protein [Labrenzia sp. VG12]|uniref:GGDEF domain-containing protein n=1 Tax=Labrenzia sp. VG12 TaxID=2021862 RepID=UPI000B8C0828|nr:GGDEF domain-containing protein [Labrenzia sp. VG12]ASP35479.1 hypothetical protein CHH27_21385 [Labrenzia sp. VG12]